MTLHLRIEHSHLVRLFAGLILFEGVLVLAYVATKAWLPPTRLWDAFNLDGEATIPAWFSSMQLFLIGLALTLAALNPARVADGLRGLLLVCGGGFAVLSMDEAVMIHEQVNRVLKRFDWLPRFPSGRGFWIFPYLAAAAAVAALSFRYLRRFARRFPEVALRFGGGVAIFLGGAVGVEVIGYELVGLHGPEHWQLAQVAAEEFMEMAGASVILVSAIHLALRDRAVDDLSPAVARVNTGLKAGA